MTAIRRLPVSVLVSVRYWFAALALIVGLAVAWPAAAAEKVVMGWVPAIDALPYMVALEEKAFEKVGIEVVDQRLNNHHRHGEYRLGSPCGQAEPHYLLYVFFYRL
jgi:hypothetical protein